MKVVVTQDGVTKEYEVDDARFAEHSLHLVRKVKPKSELAPIEKEKIVALYYGTFYVEIEHPDE